MSRLDRFREQIAAWKALGWPDCRISDHLLIAFGVDISSTWICKYRLKHGIRVGMGRRSPKLTAVQLGRLHRARRDGVTWDRLEVRFGISRPTLARYVREYRSRPGG